MGKSKEESGEKGGAAVIPICLPLCCAAPCVIMWSTSLHFDASADVALCHHVITLYCMLSQHCWRIIKCHCVSSSGTLWSFLLFLSHLMSSFLTAKVHHMTSCVDLCARMWSVITWWLKLKSHLVICHTLSSSYNFVFAFIICSWQRQVLSFIIQVSCNVTNFDTLWLLALSLSMMLTFSATPY